MMILNLPKTKPEWGPFNRRRNRDREPREPSSRSIPASNSQGNLGQITLPFLASPVE